MAKEVSLKDAEDLLERMRTKLERYGYDFVVVGGMKEKGHTTHDIDLDIRMPGSLFPPDEVFDIINKYGNELWKEHQIEFDVNFSFKRKRIYKFDRRGVAEYQEDGSILPF